MSDMNAQNLDAGSELVAENLQHAATSQGLQHGSVGHDGAHAEPKTLGMDATAWVSAAMLVLIIILLVKKVPSLIGGVLDGRIAEIKKQLDEATALRAEAEGLKQQYEAKLAAAAGDADALRARAEEDAKQLIADAEVNAKTLVARRQKMAEDKIGAAERAALADIRSKAVEAAAVAASTLIKQGHDVVADQSLVNNAIKELSVAA